jgi:hypothetical protein
VENTFNNKEDEDEKEVTDNERVLLLDVHRHAASSVTG